MWEWNEQRNWLWEPWSIEGLLMYQCTTLGSLIDLFLLTSWLRLWQRILMLTHILILYSFSSRHTGGLKLLCCPSLQWGQETSGPCGLWVKSSCSVQVGNLIAGVNTSNLSISAIWHEPCFYWECAFLMAWIGSGVTTMWSTAPILTFTLYTCTKS